jgi:hypothetical protein
MYYISQQEQFVLAEAIVALAFLESRDQVPE